MMEPFVKLALARAASDAERIALEPVAVAARALDAEERSFPSRIAENKARRGEGPTKLSKKRQAEVDGYATDADAMDAGLLAQFEGLASAASVVRCLKTALDGDVAFWSKNQSKAHPADAPLLAQFLAAKSACRDRMADYLDRFYVDEEP